MSIIITSHGVAEQTVTGTGTTGLDLYGDDRAVVAVRVNGELWDLNRALPDGATVEPVALDSPDGLNILRHSTAHVAAQAVQSRHPDARLGIGRASARASRLPGAGRIRRYQARFMTLRSRS